MKQHYEDRSLSKQVAVTLKLASHNPNPVIHFKIV
jgi:hypothetical protein